MTKIVHANELLDALGGPDGLRAKLGRLSDAVIADPILGWKLTPESVFYIKEAVQAIIEGESEFSIECTLALTRLDRSERIQLWNVLFTSLRHVVEETSIDPKAVLVVTERALTTLFADFLTDEKSAPVTTRIK